MRKKNITARGAFLGICMVALLAGCSSAPPKTHSGFLSDYSRLQAIDDNRSRYISADVKKYDAFILDPIQWRSPSDKLSEEDRAKVMAHLHDSIAKVLTKGGLTVTQTPGPKTARIRLAITKINGSTWWLKIHPATSLAGAGRGGVTFEGEVIDAVSGEQLAAFIRAGVGSQLTVANFSTTSDVDDVIDKWAEDAADHIKELRSGT